MKKKIQKCIHCKRYFTCNATNPSCIKDNICACNECDYVESCETEYLTTKEAIVYAL